MILLTSEICLKLGLVIDLMIMKKNYYNLISCDIEPNMFAYIY